MNPDGKTLPYSLHPTKTVNLSQEISTYEPAVTVPNATSG
jgi:hypothetical protein